MAQHPCSSTLYHGEITHQGNDTLSEYSLRSKQDISINKRGAPDELTGSIKPSSTTINEAFDRLREVVPSFPFEKRISKIETLRLSLSYIGTVLVQCTTV